MSSPGQAPHSVPCAVVSDARRPQPVATVKHTTAILHLRKPVPYPGDTRSTRIRSRGVSFKTVPPRGVSYTTQAALLDGVLECRREHFWSHTPGALPPFVLVRLRDKVGVATSARRTWPEGLVFGNWDQRSDQLGRFSATPAGRGARATVADAARAHVRRALCRQPARAHARRRGRAGRAHARAARVPRRGARAHRARGGVLI